MVRRLHSVAREPLVWFALIGGLIFLAYSLLGERDKPVIMVTPAMQEEMIESRREIVGRDLTDREREELVERHVRREILLREAVRRDLHLTDGVVAKRLIEKVGYLNEVPTREPSTEELETLLREQPDQFRTPRRISFEHVYFRDDLSRVEESLAALRSGKADASSLGDTFWLGSVLEDYSASQLVPLFGWRFADELWEQPTGVWSGPLRAGSASHLVRVTGRRDPEPMQGDRLKRRLMEAWRESNRAEYLDRQFGSLKKEYRILVP